MNKFMLKMKRQTIRKELYAKYHDHVDIVTEYINEAEHQDGIEFWEEGTIYDYIEDCGRYINVVLGYH